MSKRKSKQDWIVFFRNFERSKVSLASYCERNSVAYQSAKNWSSRLKKADEYPTKGGGTSTGVGTGTKGTGTGTNKTNGKAGDKSGVNSDSSDGEGKSASNPSISGDEPTATPKERVWKKHWDHLIPIKKGEQLALKHGAYASALPPDIHEHMETYGRNDLRNLIEEIKLTKGRLMMVSRKRAEWDARDNYNEDQAPHYELSQVTTESGVGVQGIINKTTKVKKRPDFEAQEDRLTRRLAWLLQVQEQLMKRSAMTADEAINLRSKIIQDGIIESKEWSSIGLEIEMHGLELPFSIKALINKELEQPVEEADTSFTDDELEEMSRNYHDEIAQDGEWIEVRKQEVDAIHELQNEEKTAT